MKRFTILTLLALTTCLLMGCNGVSYLGRVANMTFYDVKNPAPDMFEPNVKTRVACVAEDFVDEETGEVSTEERVVHMESFATDGPANALIAGGSQIASNAVLRPDETTITEETNVTATGGEGGSASQSQGQGQLQGQYQGQHQSSKNVNRNDNRNTNVDIRRPAPRPKCRRGCRRPCYHRGGGDD